MRLQGRRVGCVLSCATTPHHAKTKADTGGVMLNLDGDSCLRKDVLVGVLLCTFALAVINKLCLKNLVYICVCELFV